MKKEPGEHLTWPGPEAEVPIDPWYEKLIQAMCEWRHRAETGLVVIRSKEIPWYQNPQGRVRYYLLPPYKADTALQTMAVFEQIIYHHSGMHRHQGGLAIYVLDGEGYTIVDGERFDWTAGDLLLLPIRPGGVAHQHFNRDPSRAARWLALIPMAFQEYLGSEVVQLEESPDWHPPEKKKENTDIAVNRSLAISPQYPGPLNRPADEASRTTGPTLLDSLFQLRDEHRQQRQTGLRVVRGRDLSWEHNRQGIMRWYLHPCKRDTAIRNLVVYVQEIPPAGKSGRQRCPGGLVHFILDGHGTVEVDGLRYEWAPGDCIALPIKSCGVEYQFFNLDAQKPARYLAATPNFFEVLGVDLGSAFEQLEDAPS
jgi:gentisate 1,2-dioxygenase